MREERRKYERFPLTLTAQRETSAGAVSKIHVLEISVSGCFVEWFEDARLGDAFRLKIPLLNGNFLPVSCKVIYRFTNIGVGIQFADLSDFERQLIAEVICFQMRRQGRGSVDPLAICEVSEERSAKKFEAQFVDVR